MGVFADGSTFLFNGLNDPRLLRWFLLDASTVFCRYIIYKLMSIQFPYSLFLSISFFFSFSKPTQLQHNRVEQQLPGTHHCASNLFFKMAITSKLLINNGLIIKAWAFSSSLWRHTSSSYQCKRRQRNKNKTKHVVGIWMLSHDERVYLLLLFKSDGTYSAIRVCVCVASLTL